MKKALITGITGQDGAYLAEFLLNKRYQVHGLIGHAPLFSTAYIDRLSRDEQETRYGLKLHDTDITDAENLLRIIKEIEPDEIYNLAGQSDAKPTLDIPEYTADANTLCVGRLLEALRKSGLAENVRFYQPSTRGLYGSTNVSPINESTTFHPGSALAVAELHAYWMTVNYREVYHVYACNGIMFDHESPLRDESFVSRKITKAAALIASGLQNCLYLGNLDALRDWGHAADHAEAMWLMLQQPAPDDYVIATGITTTLREFARLCVAELGIEIEFSGKDKHEKGVVIDIDADRMEALGLDPNVLRFGQTVIKVDPQYYLPIDNDFLRGDASKARSMLGWQPRYKLEMLVAEMVAHDLDLIKKQRI